LVDWRQHKNSITYHVRKNLFGGQKKKLQTDRQMISAFAAYPSKCQPFIIRAKNNFDRWLGCGIGNFHDYGNMIRHAVKSIGHIRRDA